MASQFPTNLDDLDLTRGTSTDKLSSPSHVTHHTNEDDAIEALQTKVGIDSSADTDSIDYKLTNASSVSPGHKHVAADISDLLSTTVQQEFLSSSVTLSSAGTYYDLLSVTLTAGIWILSGQANFSANSGSGFTKYMIKVTDGSNNFSSAEISPDTATGTRSTANTMVVLNLAETTVITLQATASVNNRVVLTDVTYSAGNTATSLSAIKIG
jgi:hypothetical protein